MVSESGPGIFLQGLAVYDLQGVPLSSPNLSPEVVADAFRYSLKYDIPLCAFLGDVCATLKMHPEIEVCSGALQHRNGRAQQANCLTIAMLSVLISSGRSAEAVFRCICTQCLCPALLQELHTRYYEPLSVVPPTLEALLAGPPVKKLLFMTDPSVVESQLKPHWQVRQANLQQLGAS